MPAIAAGTGTVPWTPFRFGNWFYPILWFDAADTATIVQSAGAVSRWCDKSPYGNDATEATNKPLTGTRTINGLNALEFDGSNDQMATGNVPAFAQTAVSEVFIVCYADAIPPASGADTLVFDGTGTSTRRAMYLRGSTGEWREWQGSAEVASGLAGIVGPMIIVGEFTGGTTTGIREQNGTESAVGGNGGFNNINAVRIGAQWNLLAGRFWDGLIGEVLVFPQILPIESRTRVVRYLSGKWRIPLARAGASSPSLVVA